MNNLFLEFIFAFLGTLGFAFIFNVPKRDMPIASLVGGAGWVIYQIAISLGCGIAISCFLGACTVGLTSDIASRSPCHAGLFQIASSSPFFMPSKSRPFKEYSSGE